MALTKYQKTYSAFTGLVSPYTKPNPDRLKDEIQKSAIVTAFDHIDTDDGAQLCDIWFKDALSAGDQTLLDGIVATHSGEPLTPPQEPLAVKIQDVEDLDPKKARSKVIGINFDAPAEQWTCHPTSFPYRTNVLCGKGFGGFCEDGDKVEFSVAPQVIGVVAASAAQGAVTIYLYAPDPSVWEVLLDGMWLQFERSPGAQPGGPDSEHPGSDENEIESFDPVTGAITLRTGIATALSQGDFIYLVVKYGEAIELQKNEIVDVGSDSSGAAPLPEDTVFNTWFYNAGLLQKRVRLRLSLKYGPTME